MNDLTTGITIGLAVGFYLTVAAQLYTDHRKTKGRLLSFGIALVWMPLLCWNMVCKFWPFKMEKR